MKVLSYPHPVLKYKCKPIQKIDQGLRDIIAEMFQTMYDTQGVGLAANQVGLPYRLFVMNPSGDPEKKEEEYVFINPIILQKSGKSKENEGCLSFPDIHAEVIRPEFIDVESIALNGDLQHFQWAGYPARIVQHETDHLDGIGFIDRLSQTALLEIKEELEELKTVFASNQRRGFIPSETEIIQELKELERLRC
ncbi:MAG: peptide deformylase [Planctomycetaceae bacterium]|nr:peptide deformylase [Planctomycetaceae bacterium]